MIIHHSHQIIAWKNGNRTMMARFPFFVFLLLSAWSISIFGQISSIERSRAKDMLRAVKNELKSNYYDPEFRGIDIEAKFKLAEEKLNNATTLGQASGIIAQAVLELNDSHTTFYPPSRTVSIEYGWETKMVGDKALVIAVKPKSDAEAKGLKVGDQIVGIEGFRPVRKEMWKINYYYNSISPRNSLTLKVVSPESTEVREINISSKATKKPALVSLEDMIREIEIEKGGKILNRFIKVGNTVIWEMPSFSIGETAIDSIMNGQVKGATNLILDLRGNGGGSVKTLEQLAGYFVEKDTKIADRKGRKKMDPQMAISKGSNGFKGKLVILIDSESASASEVLARFIQLQERGVVIGDRSAGAVMQSRTIPMQLGADNIIMYGMSITNADVIMGDGNSLEHIGVVPQIEMLPDAKDLASQRDPVLAAALELLGETITPEKAGKFFPFIWEEN